MAVNVKYVGALSRKLDKAPDNQKKCQGAFKSKAAARAFRISKAGTIVTNIPRNSAATSTIGEKWKWFSRWMARGVVYQDILAIVTLGYLGLGIPPPTADLGSMINDGQNFLSTHWQLTTIPGLAVVLVGLGLSLIGDGLADILRPGQA